MQQPISMPRHEQVQNSSARKGEEIERDTEIKGEATEINRGQIVKFQLSHVKVFEFYQENTEEQINILSKTVT